MLRNDTSPEDQRFMMNRGISHNYEDETIEAKTRWFQSLPLSERMEIMCAFTDLALEINPDLPDEKDAQPPNRSFQIITRP
jgi:hypothetical protein